MTTTTFPPRTVDECVAWIRSPSFPAPLPDAFSRGVEFDGGHLSFAISPRHRHDKIAFVIAKLLDEGGHNGVAPCSLNLGACLLEADAAQDPVYEHEDDVPTDARIVVEVVSPGHEHDDRLRKAARYFDHSSAEEYWIVTPGPDRAIIDIHRRGEASWISRGDHSDRLGGQVRVWRDANGWRAQLEKTS